MINKRFKAVFLLSLVIVLGLGMDKNETSMIDANIVVSDEKISSVKSPVDSMDNELNAIKPDSAPFVVRVLGLDDLPEIKIYKPVTLNAVGDIMLSREVGRRIKKSKDWRHSFLDVGDILAKSDITFANLETTVFKGREIGAYEMMFRSDPEVIEGLKFAGIDIVSLANNHTYNFGESGIVKTMKNLNDNDISFCGAGNDDKESRSPAIIERNGTTFAFLCYNDTDVVPDSTFASAKKAGTAELVKENMISDVKSLLDAADFIIVSMHSGHEYHKLPNKKQKEFARAAIDSGANVVIGHHPHVIQPVEYYNDGIILYSLGNFVFDQYGVWQNRGVIASFTFDKNLYSIKVDFIPTKIVDLSKAQIETDEKVKKQIIDRLNLVVP